MPYEEAEIYEMDVDGDGRPDTVGVIKNEKGHTEYHIDTTGDGEFDTVAEDTTGDGVLDQKSPMGDA